MSGAFRVDLPKRTLQTTRELPPTPNEAVPPERPPKPRRKDNTEQQVVCSCMLQSESRGPRLQKSDTLNSQDSGYDSTESRESIFVEHDIVVDGERYTIRAPSLTLSLLESIVEKCSVVLPFEAVNEIL